MGRTFALASALLIVALLAFLTVRVAVRDGVDVVVVVSLIVVALIGAALIGALGAPRDD